MTHAHAHGCLRGTVSINASGCLLAAASMLLRTCSRRRPLRLSSRRVGYSRRRSPPRRRLRSLSPDHAVLRTHFAGTVRYIAARLPFLRRAGACDRDRACRTDGARARRQTVRAGRRRLGSRHLPGIARLRRADAVRRFRLHVLGAYRLFHHPAATNRETLCCGCPSAPPSDWAC